MGFRTVVVLNNDQAHEWKADADLGKKIFHAAAAKSWGRVGREEYFEYGDAVEQVHADVETLIVCENYSGRVVAQNHWFQGKTQEQTDLALLKEMADKLGYRIVRKSVKK